jgi:hypothetical protein
MNSKRTGFYSCSFVSIRGWNFFFFFRAALTNQGISSSFLGNSPRLPSAAVCKGAGIPILLIRPVGPFVEIRIPPPICNAGRARRLIFSPAGIA